MMYLEQVISLIIFTIPGLLVYFWIQVFGLNPVVKHTPTELAAIAGLFWLPTVILMIISYDIVYFLIDSLFILINVDLSSLNMKIISNFNDIQNSATNIFFVAVFFILSIVFSLLVARVWVWLYDEYLLKFINELRLNRKLTKLSDTTAVWDAFFHKLKAPKEEPLVIEIYKLDRPEVKIVGSVTKMSRPYELERALVLEHTSDWKQSTDKYEYGRERTYVDIKSGLVVTELNQNDRKQKPNPISSKEAVTEEVEPPDDPQNVAGD